MARLSVGPLTRMALLHPFFDSAQRTQLAVLSSEGISGRKAIRVPDSRCR